MKFLLDGEDWKLISNNLGSILVIIGFTFLVPTASAYYFGETERIGAFFAMAVISMALGVFLRTFNSGRYFGFRHALIISALVWLIIPMISTVIFTSIGVGFVDAYFEAMSGWTTTGLTVVQDVESLPKSVLFFRSYTHWLGGIGIILLALTVLRLPKLGQKLYAAETRSENIKLNIFDTAKLIYGTYIILTASGVVLLFLAGMPMFDSVNHSMSAISTGGFSVKNASIGSYGSLPINVITLFLMLVGGTNIVVLYYLLRGKLKYLKNSETIFTIFIAIVFSLLIMFSLRESVVNVLFTVVSTITSTGYGVVDVAAWTDTAIFALLMLMYVGASSGSTTGAIKIWRILVVAKDVYREVLRYIKSEHAFLPVRFGGKIVEEDDIRKIKTFVLVYIIVTIFFSILMMELGFSFKESIFTAASAQGNIGMSIISGTAWFNMPELAKIVIIIAMWVGRLEILPVLVLLRSMLPVRK